MGLEYSSVAGEGEGRLDVEPRLGSLADICM